VIAYRILVIAILAVGGILTALAVGIVLNKARREARALADRRRRDALEPRILAAIHAEARDTPSGSLPEKPFRLAVGSLPHGRDARVVEAVLADHATRVRGVARERISQAFEELGFVDLYMDGLSASWWWRRADSAERLGLARAIRATDALVARMEDPVAEVRMRAAKSLGEIRGRAAVRPLVEALARPSRWSTLRVADILSRMGEEAAEEIRIAWPRLTRPARLASLDILGKLHRLESIDFIAGVLRNADSDERARAAHALGMIGHAGPVPDLVRALQDPDWPVRAMSAKALGRIGSADAVEPLARALRDKEWWVRSNAAGAMKLLGPRGQQALVDTLEDQDPYARHQAVLMLQETGALAQFVSALDSRVEGERKAAERLIRLIVDMGRTDYLGDQAREYPNFRVRDRLDELLGKGRA
jgi:HEAT repeat protein